MREYTPERLAATDPAGGKISYCLVCVQRNLRLEALLRLPKGTEHFMSDLQRRA